MKNLIWIGLNQVALSGGAAGLVVMLSFFLDRETFGDLRYISSILAILAFFSLPGVGTVLIKDVTQSTRQSFKHAIFSQLQWGLGSTIGGLLFFAYYVYQQNTDIAYAFLVGGLLAPIANLYLIPGQALAGFKRFKEKTVVDGIIMISIILGAGTGAILTHTVFGTILFYFGTQVAVTLFLIGYVFSLLPKESESTTHKSDIQYAKQLTFFQIPFMLLPSLERVFVFLLLGPVALAVFVVATIPAEHMKSALRNLFQFYILPHMSDGAFSKQSLRPWFVWAGGITALAVFVAGIFILLFMPILFPQYEESYMLAFVLVLGLIPLPTQVMTLSWIMAKRIDLLLPYTYMTVIIEIILLFLLVPTFGVKGAVIAKIVFEGLVAGFIVFLHNYGFEKENALL